MQEAVGHILKLPTLPDIVLVTGDCADNGLPEEYQLVQQCLAPLTMPVYLIPGNRDNRQNLRRTFGESRAAGITPSSSNMLWKRNRYGYWRWTPCTRVMGVGSSAWNGWTG
ncbi:MAG: metallophosphoesterase [Ardenticatenales bacterium]|nr:metallophosphoesterase [Ardenticatenales bacterium]